MRWFARTIRPLHTPFRRCRLEQLEPRTLLTAAPLLGAIETTALAYIENQAARPITGAITISDADSPNLVGATIQIVGNHNSDQDELAFDDMGPIAGTWTAATGTLVLGGTDTPANYEAALRAVKYRNTSDSPATVTRTIAFTVNDGTAQSNAVSRNITVIAVNDAPEGTDARRTVAARGTYTFAASDFGFHDALDAPAHALKAVKIATLPEAGSLTCGGVAVVAGQSVSAAEIAAGQLVFVPAAGASGADYAQFTFQVQDDGGAASLAPFTVVVLPDTQSHAAQAAWFNTQIQWICDNFEGLNTAFVTHVGDVTNTNSTSEWANAREAMYRLDGRVPWGIIPGNHDTVAGFLGSFGPEHFAGRSWYGGAYSASSYQYFAAAGRVFLSLEIAYGAGADVFTWAQGVLDNNLGVPTIVTTHDYMTSAGARTSAGNTLWNSLIKLNPQIFMVLCGHYGNKGNLAHNVVYDDAGQPVFQIVSNYQETPPYEAVWLRLMEFDEPSSEIRVNTYSPYYQGDWETVVGGSYVANNRFELALNFVERFGPAGEPSGVDLDPTPNTMTIDVSACNLDADGSGVAEPLADGILILRYLFDTGGAWAVDDALGAGATRIQREEIRTFLDADAGMLDADGNGAADPLSDGILILRYLLEPAGSWGVEDALGSGATRTTAASIRAYLEAFNPGAAATAPRGLGEALLGQIARALVAAFEEEDSWAGAWNGGGPGLERG